MVSTKSGVQLMEGERRDWVRDFGLVEVRIRPVRMAAAEVVFCGCGVVVLKDLGRWRAVLERGGVSLESKENIFLGPYALCQ